MMRATIRPRREDVRQAILDAAAAEFGDHGYANTTIDQIAARAGFTKGAAYSNFGGKPELFAAACAAHYDATTAGIGTEALAALPTYGRILDPAQRHRVIDAVATALTPIAIDGGSWHQTLDEFRALARHDPDVAAVYAELLTRQRLDLADRLRHSGLDPRVTGPDPYLTAAVLLLSTLDQLSLEHAASPDTTTPELVSACLSTLVGGLLA